MVVIWMAAALVAALSGAAAWIYWKIAEAELAATKDDLRKLARQKGMTVLEEGDDVP